MSRIRILQLFSKYLQYGGEEGSVYRIGDAMQTDFDVEYFISQTTELLSGSPLSLPYRTYRNSSVLKRLETYQRVGRFDFWQVHNVFPAISPGAYTLAQEIGIPIIHYLHNYRMGCVNGYLFTKGVECKKCIAGAYWHGAFGRCWRESMPQSTMMALLVADTRRRGLFDQVKKWIAISEAQKRIHVAIGLPEEKIEVVHHFLDHDLENVPTPIPKDGYALFIGRLSPEKGLDRLLEAWAALPKNHKLVIAGDGPDLNRLQELAETHQLGNVTFAGFVPKDKQGELWDGAAFLVVPSVWQEPFGMVVLEAWARGRSVVAHSVGAMPELIEEGYNGMLADQDIEGALSEAIANAFASHSDLVRMAENGQRDLLEKYNRTVWLSKMKNLYESAQIQ